MPIWGGEIIEMFNKLAVRLFLILSATVFLFLNISFFSVAGETDNDTDVVNANAYVYTMPSAPCTWNCKVEQKAMFQYARYDIYVHGRFYKSESIDYRGNIYYSSIDRPDYGTGVSFTYDADKGSCVVQTDTMSKHTYADVIWAGGCMNSYTKDFNYVEDATFNHVSCRAYYDDNINKSAFYVRKSDGLPVACVTNDDAPDVRMETTFDFGTFAPMSSFSFSKSGVYKCSDYRIFQDPSDEFAKCAASSVKVTPFVFSSYRKSSSSFKFLTK